MKGFNLLEESWIKVMVDDRGSTKEVSLVDIFQNAHQYKMLAGEMEIQNFAILRLLLSVLHTVFSRYDSNGTKYEWLNLDESGIPISEVGEDDESEFKEVLMETWDTLWSNEEFPGIVLTYLEDWRERFNLYDEEYPFYQVRKEDISPNHLEKGNAGGIKPRNINRLISESGNKLALFSPKNEENKDVLTDAELARWLITLQNYFGTADKSKFKTSNKNVTLSKGWLYDLGGLYLKGETLFETLMLNLAIVHPEKEYSLNVQKPCWESHPSEVIKKNLMGFAPDNLAQLYTAWSRAIYIDPEFRGKENLELKIVKLREVPHADQYLELMTLWRYNKEGDYKDHFTPRKHSPNQSLWRSFGQINLKNKDENHHPGIIDWYRNIEKSTRQNVQFASVSLKDDGNATSWAPSDHVSDTLELEKQVFLNDEWTVRIYDEVALTQQVINSVLGKFLQDVVKIRNLQKSGFRASVIERTYFDVDLPFRRWIRSIHVDDDMDVTVKKWRVELKQLVDNTVDEVLETSGNRDYLGITDNERTLNIEIAHIKFQIQFKKTLEGGVV